MTVNTRFLASAHPLRCQWLQFIYARISVTNV